MEATGALHVCCEMLKLSQSVRQLGCKTGISSL